MNIETHIIGGASVEVHRKQIKNLHVGVYPPNGHVRVAAPLALSPDAIMTAVLTKMPWIKRKQAQFLSQERQTVRQYISGETHYVFGRAMRLEVDFWTKQKHEIRMAANDRLSFRIPEDSKVSDRQKWIERWRKAQLKAVAAPLFELWSARLNVAPQQWGIRRMRTKWGSCNPDKQTVWLNSELSKTSPAAIEYVVLHELAHLISARHNDEFLAVLDMHMPKWRSIRAELNKQPLAAWTEIDALE